MDANTATPQDTVQPTYLLSTANGKYKNVPIVGHWPEVFRMMDEEDIRSAKVHNTMMGSRHTVRRGIDGEYVTGADY